MTSDSEGEMGENNMNLLMFISAKVAIVGKSTYKRSDKCVKMTTRFEPMPLPAFPDAFFF